MYVDIIISNVFNLNKLFFSFSFLYINNVIDYNENDTHLLATYGNSFFQWRECLWVVLAVCKHLVCFILGLV